METRTDQRQAKLEYEGKTRHDTTLKTFPGSHLLSALRKIDAPSLGEGRGRLSGHAADAGGQMS